MAHDLASLITVLQEDRVHKKELVEALLEKAASLKNLLEQSVTQHHHSWDEIVNALQTEIRDAAHEAEDIIESHAVNQTLPEPEAATSVIISPPDLSMSKVMEKFDAASDKLRNVIKLQSHDEEETTTDAISNPSSSAAADPTMMVGFEEDALQLKHRLTSQRSAREIIPIVGMGGIGKTTLARNLYDDPLIVSHFDVCAWATVSQDYSVRAILLGLLSSKSEDISEDTLGDTLYRRLYGRRYLVVLDDMWSEKAWDEIQRYFPNDNTKSRILITSRELHVAKHADSACEEHQMHLLSDDQGWDLLRLKVFGRNLITSDPHFLEEIGRKIASDCRGLPLAISVIGGLLSVDKYSKDLWVRVAKDIRSITDNHVSKILCLSYDKLPLHLKPCFLYMSAFPEDFEVRHSKLVKLLVAEGFLMRSNGENCKRWEDVAEEHLKALVDRNLLSITRAKYNGRAESYSMHDLLRDVCVRKAEEEKFLRIFKNGDDVSDFRRVSVHHHEFTEDQFAEDTAHGMSGDLSCSRSLLYITSYPFIDISSILSTLRLVRVLNVYDIHFDDFPTEILKMANLRLLVILFHGSLPSAVWRLQNLQTLQVRIYEPDDVTLPYEAWEISGLRHIVVKNVPISIDFKVPRVHENLQTIGGVCLDDFLASDLINNIPNVRGLKISGYGFVSEGEIIDLSHLQKLETLKLESFSVDVLSLLKLPDCLKKLSYFTCTLPMRVVNSVGDLQHLEVLKIDSCVFQSEEHNEEEEGDDEDGEEEWDLNEGVEFDSLQLLWVRNLRIKRWKADYSNFPRLRHLKIGDCEVLEEIPACFEEISTLEMIEVSGYYNPSHVDWANRVRETQREEYGNETLKIRMN